MQVVRLEMPDGVGPWRSDYFSVLDHMPVTYERHATFNVKGMPTPFRDGIDVMDDKDVCGYKSLEEMEKWVDLDELGKAIKEWGMEVKMFITEHVKIGGHQVVFNRELATEIIDISDRYIKNVNQNEEIKNYSRTNYSCTPVIVPEGESQSLHESFTDEL